MQIYCWQMTAIAYKKLKQLGFHQVVTMPTRDSGTLIDHVYISPGLKAEAKVADCYYSDHDCVLASIVA